MLFQQKSRYAFLCLSASATIITLNAFAQTSPQPVANLSEALHQSLYFYDAEKSGPSRTLGRQPLEWRSDSEPSDAAVPLIYDLNKGTNLSESFIERFRDVLDPDGNGSLDLSGGFHDAGDHVKFGLPQSYSASTLGWGLYEFKESFIKAGAYDHMMDELYWVTDYFLRSTFMDATGEVIAFNYMVGNGGTDHTYWGPPELQDPERYPRPATFAYAEEPGSDQAAGASAALAIMYLNTKDNDPDYAAKCLLVAKALYQFAVKYRGTGNGDGFYNSSYDYDELAWAATWLFIATDETHYVTDIIAHDDNGNYTGYFSRIVKTPADDWQNIWVHSWDTVWGGVFAKLAPATKGILSESDNEKLWYYFRWNLEYWSGGTVAHDNPADGHYLTQSPAGWAFLTTWGSARYNTAAQLGALVYRKYAGETEKAIGLTDWALSQMNYIMGDNPKGLSYIVGFTDKHVKYPHHRAAHGGVGNDMKVPVENSHTLWGALVGGPDIDDNHNDSREDYIYNEVAIDYNAAFVGALAGFIEFYGADQEMVLWSPPLEGEEKAFYSHAMVEQESDQRSQITVRIHNFVTHPPQYEENLSLRYYFNISELLAYGQSIDDIKCEVYYDEVSLKGFATKASGPFVHDQEQGIYYVEFAWTGAQFYGARDLQFALVTGQDSKWRTHWDSSNDWSRAGLTNQMTESPRIPVYNKGELVFGLEPGVVVSPEPTPPSTPTPTPTPTPPGATPEPTITPVPTVTPTPVASPECEFDYVVKNQWDSGFVAALMVTNVGQQSTESWSVTLTYPEGTSIVNSWGADISGSSVVTAKSLSWNAILASGRSAEIGLQAVTNGAQQMPEIAGTCD